MKNEHIFDCIEISQYRSYNSLHNFMLNPINVLIGENGSGKSNFLEIFAMIKHASVGEMQKFIDNLGGLNEIITYEGELNLEIKLGLPIRYPDPNKVHPFIKIRFNNIQSGYVVGNEIIGYQAPSYDSPYEWLWRDNKEIHYKGYEKIEEEPAPLFSEIPEQEKELKLIYTSIHNQLADLEIPNGELSLPMFKGAVNLNGDLSFIQKVLSEVGDYRKLRFDERSPIRFPQTLQFATRLEPDGSNLVSVLYNMKTEPKYKPLWDKFTNYIKIAFDDFEDLDFPTAGGDGKIQISWHSPYYPTKGFSANTLSTGTLQYLCLLAIFLSPNPPPLIIIEEPENHLNPRMFPPLAEAIYDSTERTQVILTTHSPLFLNNFEPEDIIVTEKEEGHTILNRMSDKESVREFLQEFTPGEIMGKGLYHD